MRPTPEATIGPFYPGAFVGAFPQDLWQVSPLVAHHPHGEPIVLAVRVFDALRRPVPSVVIECWQANAHGRYRHPADQSSRPLDPQFDGFARLRTSDEGMIRLHTIKPGPCPVAEGSDAMRAPHIRLTIFASGIDRLVTHVFFDGEPLNATDPVLNSLPDPEDRARLIATPDRVKSGEHREYVVDVVLRGDRETPFFDDWSA
jgi:protocatechuate 3,4-dioxygenase beta subunit